MDLFFLTANKLAPSRSGRMWSIDAPNPGDAAVVNEKALKWGYAPVLYVLALIREFDQVL